MIAAITGASGFIGRHLVHRFSEAGWDVRPVVRRDFEVGTVDGLVNGVDVVVHAAGATRAPTEAQLDASNVVLTARVLDAARRGGATRFVFISSLAAAGPAPSLEAPVTEETVAAPVEVYGRTKLAAERIVRDGYGDSSVIVRPSAVYGPGDRDFLMMFRLARRGVAIHPANRERWLSIIHVSDLVEAVFRCASAPSAAEREYFLSNDEPVQWARLFQMAAECAEQTLRIDVNLPSALVRVGSMLGDAVAHATGRASLMTSGKAALSTPPYWVCSNARAKRELSFSPRIDLQAGLRDTYHWYVEQGWF